VRLLEYHLEEPFILLKQRNEDEVILMNRLLGPGGGEIKVSLEI
jgi:hypothetical protein